MMSQITMKTRWVMELEPADARLLLRALGGRLKGPEIDEAKKLGDELTKQRYAQAAAHAMEMKKHADNVEE